MHALHSMNFDDTIINLVIEGTCMYGFIVLCSNYRNIVFFHRTPGIMQNVMFYFFQFSIFCILLEQCKL